MDQSQTNLKQLHDSVDHEYGQILRSVLLRVATLLIALGLIWIFSELWRRATFRYIKDARRRRQFLVLRRVITGFCMFVVVLLGFVSDFSSLATYAGLDHRRRCSRVADRYFVGGCLFFPGGTIWSSCRRSSDGGLQRRQQRHRRCGRHWPGAFLPDGISGKRH